MKQLTIWGVLSIFLGSTSISWAQTEDVVTENAKPSENSTNHVFNDPTGICFRHLQWSEGGELHSRYEVVLTKQSSSLKKDMERLKELESTNYHFRNPHIIPFVWLGALIDDKFGEFGTDKLDCSSLPTIVENNQ